MALLLYVAFILIVSFAIWLFKRFYLETLFLGNLSQKSVFVTGCDSGFGQLLVLKLVRAGITCYAGCLTEKGEKELGDTIKTDGLNISLLQTLQVDVTRVDSVTKAAVQIQQNLAAAGSSLWGIVCNAGVAGIPVPDDWLTIEDYQRTSDVNLWGIIRTCHAFKQLIKKSHGRIVITTSFVGRLAPPTAGPYTVSKFGAEAYGDVLRRELRSFGVSVHLIEPGCFRTPMTSTVSIANANKTRWDALPAAIKQEYGQDYIQKRCAFATRVLNYYNSPDTWRVADAYFHALAAKFPRNRYLVGWDAMFFYAPMSVLPDFVQDTILYVLTVVLREPRPLGIKQ